MLNYFLFAGAYLLGWFLFDHVKLKNQTGGNYLAFHDISDKFDLSITRLSPHRFNYIIKCLAKSGFKGTSIDGLKNEKDVAFTFDDGWEGFYDDVFPVLYKHNFSATVFVVAGYVGKKSVWDYSNKMHLSWEQIRTLASEGIEIASHSINHVDLRNLDDKQLEYEVAGSKKMIEDKLGLPVKHFSYPFGRYDRRVIDTVKQAGYEKAFTLGAGKGDYAVGRRPVYLYDTPYSVYLKLTGNSWLERCKDYVNNSLAGGTITLRKLFPVKNRG